MIRFRNHIVIILLAGPGLLISCLQKTEEPSPKSLPFVVEVPSNFEELPYPPNNLFSKEKIELGKMLFYDPVLSANNTVSCATCHHQRIAFTDGDVLTRRGVTGKPLLRHTPALINLAWIPGLFWEGGSKNLESLSLGPINHPDEMGQDVVELVEEINAIPVYREKFRDAFGVEEVELTQILFALAQFQRTLISADSRYDKYVRGEEGGDMSSLELDGLQVYEKYCSSCHSTDLFTDNAYHNNGIDDEWNDISEEYIFTGRFRITFDSADLGKYKTPTLRNIELTAPYMHDGRFATLEDVLDHYRFGVKASATLDPALYQNDGKPGIPIKDGEKEALLAFLMTLTDREFITNPEFAPPPPR